MHLFSLKDLQGNLPASVISLAEVSRYRLLAWRRFPFVALLTASSIPEDSDFSSSSIDAATEATLGTLNPSSI